MSQEISTKLAEILRGQESMEARLGERLDAIQGSVRSLREQDLVAMMGAIQGVAATVNGNSTRLSRLSELVEIQAARGGSTARAAARSQAL